MHSFCKMFCLLSILKYFTNVIPLHKPAEKYYWAKYQDKLLKRRRKKEQNKTIKAESKCFYKFTHEKEECWIKHLYTLLLAASIQNRICQLFKSKYI